MFHRLRFPAGLFCARPQPTPNLPTPCKTPGCAVCSGVAGRPQRESVSAQFRGRCGGDRGRSHLVPDLDAPRHGSHVLKNMHLCQSVRLASTCVCCAVVDIMPCARVCLAGISRALGLSSVRRGSEKPPFGLCTICDAFCRQVCTRCNVCVSCLCVCVCVCVSLFVWRPQTPTHLRTHTRGRPAHTYTHAPAHTLSHTRDRRVDPNIVSWNRVVLLHG